MVRLVSLVFLILSLSPLTSSADDTSVTEGLWIRSAETAPDRRPPDLPPVPEAVPSRKDDPQARDDYARMRLADPATGEIPVDIHRLERGFAERLPVWERGSALAEAGAGLRKASSLAWQWRGPTNIGGRTRAVALDVTDPSANTMLAGGISGGMWRTIDGGNTWELTTGSTQLHSVSTVAQDTRAGHTDTWYYGTGELRGNSAAASGAAYRGDGIFKSTDGGLTWSPLPSTSTQTPQSFDQDFDYVWRIVVDPTNATEDEVYAATYGGIYRSLDGGTSWSFVLGSPSVRADYTDLIITSTGVLYATLSSDGGQKGVFRSPDGVNWTDITPPGISTFGRIVVAAAPSNEDIVYALVADQDESVNGTDYHGFHRYTYLSGDGSGAGGTWVDRSANIQGLPDQNGPGNWDFQGYGGYCQMIGIKPDDPDVVFVGGVHLVRSTDGFATGSNTDWVGGWTYTNHHADLHWMFFHPTDPNVAFTGSDGGVHRTSDAMASTVSWDSWNNGYRTSQFYTVAIDENDPGNDIVIGGMQDNGTWWTNTTSGSVDWIEQLGGDGSFCVVADASGLTGTYYFSVQNGIIYRFTVSSLGGWQTWTRVDPATAGNYLFINPFVADPADTRILYVATSNGVWRNDDATVIPLWQDTATSINWVHVTSQPASTTIGALEVARDGSRSLFFGTRTGQVYELPSAHTASAGSSPVLLNGGSAMPSGYVSSIATDPSDSDRMLVGISSYNVVNLWYTDDRGATWTAVEGNLGGTNSPSVRDVAMIQAPGAAELFLAATSTGLYSTFHLDGADTIWRRESDDLVGTVVVDMLKVRPSDSLVVVGTHGKGVYSLEVPAGTAAPEAASRLSMDGNTPNPFNPRTRLHFSVDRDGPVVISVRDVAGRQVRTLMRRHLPAGEHAVTWDGLDDRGDEVSSGVYLVSLESAGRRVSQKVTLVR